MKKSDLKTGMIVVHRDGKEFMVYKDVDTFWATGDILVAIDGSNDWIGLENYREDLITHNIDWDIVKVIKISHPFGVLQENYPEVTREVIFEGNYNK